MDAGRGEARLKVFRIGPALSLSEILPMLSSMGVEVVDERPYQLEGLGRPTFIYEFGLRYGQTVPALARELFQDALRAVWDGYNEIDGFNALVLGAGLTWRQATVLRAYAKYMRQGNSPFALDYIEDALRNNVDITRLLVQLFESRFDPGKNGLDARDEARVAKVEEVERRLTHALDEVASLDQDRILRSYMTHIKATLRTNYFQPAGGRPACTPTCRSRWSRRPSRTCRSRGRSTRSSSTPRGSRACTCASAPSPAVACAGPTAATTSAPRSWAWSRRRWSRTP